jgi:hypothetical protein
VWPTVCEHDPNVLDCLPAASSQGAAQEILLGLRPAHRPPKAHGGVPSQAPAQTPVQLVRAGAAEGHSHGLRASQAAVCPESMKCPCLWLTDAMVRKGGLNTVFPPSHGIRI